VMLAMSQKATREEELAFPKTTGEGNQEKTTLTFLPGTRARTELSPELCTLLLDVHCVLLDNMVRSPLEFIIHAAKDL
jgi:hypothetical protein